MHSYGYHPVLGVTIRSDGLVLVPASGTHKAHWTFGWSSNGYLHARINGKNYRVHRLVAQAFLPNPENLPEVDHINRNRADNRVENLRWVTHSENNRNTRAHDRVDARGGTHSFEDMKQFKRENSARYYAQNRDKKISDFNLYRKSKSLTHKRIHFSDGKYRWIPNELASILLSIPVKERKYGKMD